MVYVRENQSQIAHDTESQVIKWVIRQDPIRMSTRKWNFMRAAWLDLEWVEWRVRGRGLHWSRVAFPTFVLGWRSTIYTGEFFSVVDMGKPTTRPTVSCWHPAFAVSTTTIPTFWGEPEFPFDISL